MSAQHRHQRVIREPQGGVGLLLRRPGSLAGRESQLAREFPPGRRAGSDLDLLDDVESTGGGDTDGAGPDEARLGLLGLQRPLGVSGHDLGGGSQLEFL